MAEELDESSCRRLLLAATLIDNLDLSLDGGQACVEGVATIAWQEVAYAARHCAPETQAAIDSVRAWVTARVRLARLTPEQLVSQARPVGLPREHALHPGELWPCEHVLGGALDVGVGYRQLSDDGELVAPLDPVMARAVGVDRDELWLRAATYRADLARYAIERLHRDAHSTLRTSGDCDVPTLLSHTPLREEIVAVDELGMRSAAVPLRTHGWLDLGRIDPSFAMTAAREVDPVLRGFDRPLLITRDEVVQVPEGGHHDLVDLVSA